MGQGTAGWQVVQDLSEVGACGEEAEGERAAGAIVGSDEQDGTIGTDRAVGQRGATGDGSGEGEGQQRGMTAGGGI